MVTELQKKAAQAIVNIFETGSPQGDYGKVTLLPGDGGHLTYGRSQTTLAGGNLHLLIKAYCEAPDAQFATALETYLDRLADRDVGLDRDATFRGLLREAGDDPIMQEVQDRFFDRVYWTPSEQAAGAMGICTGLGTGVVYDSRIHGSWGPMRDRTNDRHGPVGEIGEKAWVEHYVSERRDWLANHSNRLLRQTVYRMDAFRRLVDEANWELELPFRVRGILIDEEVLLGAAPVRASAQAEDERTLRLKTPYMVGDDVQVVQQALEKEGFPIRADGIFGPYTEAAVKRFQQQRGLRVDGIVGPATRSVLGL